MLSDSLSLWRIAPHILITLAVTIGIVQIAFVLVGDALNDALDPRRTSGPALQSWRFSDPLGTVLKVHGARTAPNASMLLSGSRHRSRRSFSSDLVSSSMLYLAGAFVFAFLVLWVADLSGFAIIDWPWEPVDPRRQEVAVVSATAAAAAAEARATFQALEAENRQMASDIATSDASSHAASTRSAAAETTAVALATHSARSEERLSAASERLARAEATMESMGDSVRLVGLNPTRVPEAIQTDLDGMLAGNPAQLDATRRELRQTFSRYGEDCRAGFVLISGYAPEVGPGLRLARIVEELLMEELNAQFGDAGTEIFAMPGSHPSGQVGFDVFFYEGCQPEP